MCRDFNDSKQLTEAKRDSLFASINADYRMGYVSEVISAHYISTSMLSRSKISLNKIAEDSTFKVHVGI